jgi:integrase
LLGYWWDTGDPQTRMVDLTATAVSDRRSRWQHPSVARTSFVMTALKANSEVIRKALKGARARYTLAGHEGLCLHTRGDGSGSWLVRYRVAGRRQWHTLHNDARHAVLADVIDAKDKWLAKLKLESVDPKAELKKARLKAAAAIYTFDQAFEDWITHIGSRRRRKLARRSEAAYRLLHTLHIKPHVGKKAVAQLTREDIETAIAKIKKATTDEKKGHRGLQALKALKQIRTVCEAAIDAGYIDRNPTHGIPDPVPIANPRGKTSRPLTNEELRVLWTEAPQSMSPAIVRVLQLTLLLGRRISEIAGAARSDVRLDQVPAVLFIPADREGNKAKRDDPVPLPPLALAIIKAALEHGTDSDPLFKGAATRWTTSHAFKDFRREKDWAGRTRLHDARSLINDQLAAMGVPTEFRSRVLHHTGDLRQLANTVYSAYDYIPERLKALALWQARLLEIVNAQPPTGLRW